MITAKEFWDWFESNQAQYLFVNEVDPTEQERMVTELAEKLKEFHPQLAFQIGSRDNSEQQLIITAEGNPDHFPDVEDLVNHAPSLSDWTIIPFKPPMGVDFSINHQGLEIDPSTMYFRPMTAASDPEALGIRVTLPGYDKNHRERMLDLTYLVLDTLLGEVSFANDIQYVDVCEPPTDPEHSQFIPLSRLAEFIDWKKNRPRSV